MKKSKFLVALACFGLLVTGCNKPAESKESKPASASGNSQAVQPSSNKPSSSAPASSTQPAHEHSYAAVGTAVKNADDKDVFLKRCSANDDQYIGILFDDFSEKSADFGSTSNYNNVPEEIRNESKLLAKDSTISWKINVNKAITGAKLAFGVVYTGSDHGSQGAADGSTMKYSVKVNNGEFADWDIGEETYDSLGLSQTARAYVNYATISLVEGENVITLRQNNAGYRLLYGGEVRVHFTGDAVPVAASTVIPPVPADGYTITFASSNCKIYAYDDEDFTVDPKEVTGPVLSRDSDGNITKYVAPDAAQGIAEVKPQINFKVVCNEGYEVDTNCISISGTEHNEWNHLDDIRDGIFSVTTIKADITITVTPVTTGTLKAGYVATFATEHCTVKVYTAKDFKVEDTATPYMSRNKNKADDDTYPYAKGEDAQLSFEVIPEENYEFVSGLAVGAEAKANAIDFIAPEGYNKIKRTAENRYNLTKVSRDLAITIACTEKLPEPPVDGTKVSKTVAQLKADNNWENAGVVSSFAVGEVQVTVTGTSDSKYYDSGSNIRIYVTAGNTGIVAFAANSGYKIVSLKITYTWNKTYGTFPLASDEEASVNNTTASYTITNTSTTDGQNEQMRITAFEIVYKEA